KGDKMQKARPSKGTPRGGQGASPSGQFRVPQLTAQQLRAQQQQEEEDAAMDALDDALIFDDEEGGTRIGDIYIPPPSVGPRLIIAKIVNHNFKSYAGTVVLGPFHQSFTAIIGPNGSGKSNVIDSMMFVFGCRANRIRCKRVSTLIHSSSKFQNLRNVPNSNIVIERTAMSDNSSYYMVNGKRAQLKDVAKLLKQHHVDLEHNRFLILQGEVESIAMMKPKGQTENETGMLEYLEDIQINQRVDQLTDDRTEKHNRCKLAEREMKDLEQPFNEAVDYLKKENEMVRTKSVHIQKIVSIKKTKLEQYTKEHETAYESLVKTREQIKKRLATVERAHTEIQSTMESTNKQRKKDKTQVEKNDKELEDLHKLPEKNQREIEDCTQKLESLEKNKAELTNTTAPLTEKRLQLSDDLVGLNGKVNAAKAELQVLESQLKILKQAETTESRKYETLKSSYEQSQKSLEEKVTRMEGKIPGILGRLGDLGGIDAKYDVAISTACGRLDNIVTDSYDTAAAAIAALKEHNVGRATFITLDKIEQHRRDANSRINTPENVPRLYDLVKVEDDRVRTAFYFALRNTLVCDDLDQGTRIAYGRERFRVVTLRGEMIEMTGTMSGGGNRPVRTKTAESADSSQMTQKALEEMQIQAEELQTRVNYCQEQQGSLEREIQTLKMVLQRDEAEYKKLACEAQRQRMLKKTTDEGAVKELEEQIEAAKQEVEQAQFAEQAVTSQIEEIQTQYDTLRNDNVKPVEAKIKKVGSQIEKLAANNITAAEEKLKSLNEDRNKCQEKKEALEKEAGEADAAIEGAKSQSSDIKKQIDEITKEENKRNLDRVEIDAKLQAAAGKMNKIPGETEPPAPLKELSEEELEAESLEALQYKQTMLEEDLKTKKPNLGCIKEFNERRIVYLDRVRVLEDITSKRNEMRDKYEEMITLGGDAELELVDSMDPFNEGVNFTVRPPKKSWKYISNLSGGEKTLSSLALVFALHYYKPSPLYFMDEIDAALDFKNVSINAQFIIVSLRVNMFELANYLVGIYKVSDCTSSCTVRNHPPDLASKQATRPHSQYAGGTVAQDQTLLPVNNENQSPDSQARPTARETIRPSEPGSQTSRQLGRETTFAPTIESTGRGTTFEQNVDRAVVKDVLEVPNAPQRFSTDVNLESPPSSPTLAIILEQIPSNASVVVFLISVISSPESQALATWGSSGKEPNSGTPISAHMAAAPPVLAGKISELFPQLPQRKLLMFSITPTMDENKIHKVSDNLLISTTGESGDTEQFTEFISKNIALYKMRNGYDLSPHAAAHFTRKNLAEYLRSRTPYQVFMFVAGYDPNEGPELTFIDYLANAKSLNYAGHGYGAVFASSIYDRYWHPNITQEEAYDVFKKCIVEIQKRLVVNLKNFNVAVVDKDGYLSDPNDTRLRKVEREVLIPKIMRDRAKAEFCSKEVADFQECCKASSILMVATCRKQNSALKECLTQWYQNEAFKEEKMEEDEVCRVCLQQGGDMINIFDSEPEQEICISELIAQWSGYQVKRGDLLPETICPTCLKDARATFEFTRNFSDGDDSINDVGRGIHVPDNNALEYRVKNEPVDDDIYMESVCEVSRNKIDQSNNDLFEEDVCKIELTDISSRGKRRYKCSLCPKSFVVASQFSQHILTHSGDDADECPTWGLSEPDPKTIAYEEDDYIPPPVTDSPPKKKQSKRHTFAEAQHLKKHIEDHSDSPKTLTTSETKKRKFKCPQCPKSFPYSSSCSRHLLSHSEIRPYKCPHCPNSYARPYALRAHAHLLTHKIKRGKDNPYWCSQCKKSFLSTSNLNRHTRLHSGDKPHKCDDCEKSFSRASDLRNHNRSHTDMIAATSVLQQQAADIRTRTINWASYMQSQMISEEDYKAISALDKSRASHLAQNSSQVVKTLLNLVSHLSKDSTIQYILEDRSRVDLFHETAGKLKQCIWGPFLNLLNRQDGFIVNMSSRILAKFACWGHETMPKSDLNFYLQFLKDQLASNGLAYLQEMALLAKRTQTIIVHTHQQHGKDKDHHGHQYSPTLAQLQQQHELAERANESYREVGGSSDYQQQDGKCVIPNNEYIQSVARCLQMMLRVDEYRFAFVGVDGISTLIRILSTRVNFQVQYQLIFCLWVLTFNPLLAAKMNKFSVTRIILAVFRNLIEKPEDSSVAKDHCIAMVQCKVLKQLSIFEQRRFDDEDITADVEYLSEKLQNSVRSGRLEWSPVHKSAKFWRENAQRLNEKNYELLRILVHLLETSKDAIILSVACFDIGEYVRHYPRGKHVLEQLGGKQIVMQHLGHEDPNVRYEALLAVQKLMVHNWEYLGKQLEKENENQKQGAAPISGKA
ncbi:hypothetical protein M5D96_003298, partial [Drosophila gunungcola]